MAVVADLHYEFGDPHTDVVQQPQQCVVICRICQGAQGLMALARRVRGLLQTPT